MSRIMAANQQAQAQAPSQTQAHVQEMLHQAQTGSGLSLPLEKLFAWSLDAGYFRDGIFDGNEVLHFPDPDSPVIYRIQINRSRSGYVAPGQARPGCPICFDQVASGSKPLLRAYELTLGEAATSYFAQLTPFPLRRRHYIVIQTAHAPMRVDRRSVDELADFVQRAPEFTACSNSDVRNAGVSILDHHHYQVFADYDLPVMQAEPLAGMEDKHGAVWLALLDYPLTTLRLRGDRSAVVETASRVIDDWKALAPGRNTCNLTARRTGEEEFEFYLFFRNPDHLTPPDLLRIKSEGVGVVEASGEAIFPSPEEPVMEEIRRDGLLIIKRILSGLNPVPLTERPALFRSIRAWLEKG